MLKNLAIVLIVLFVIIIAWVGMSVYETKFVSTINPNAEAYTTPIDPACKTQGFEKVNDLKENLKVSPQHMRDLEDSIEN